MSERQFLRALRMAVVILAASGAVAIVVLAASLRLEHSISITLPTPTGPFAVGRALYDWADDVARDTSAPPRGVGREVLAWIWYPAATAPSTPADDYLPDRLIAAVERARGPLISKFLTRDLSKVHTHSARRPEVSPLQSSYPVVIFRGGASAEVWNYSTLAEDLASHGYVVVGFDAPYRTSVVAFPDGRVMRRTPENDPELALGAPDSARRINRLLAAWTGDIAFSQIGCGT